MTAIIKKIEKFARNQEVEFAPHPSYQFGTLALGSYTIIVGDTGNAIEFTAEVPPDFKSHSLEKLPNELSSILLRRNQVAHFVRWAIEFGSDSKEYFYCCRTVLPYNELSEQAFGAIAKSLYLECQFYEKSINSYS